MNRICSRCKKKKPLKEFGSCSNAKHSKSYYCKICSRIISKEHRTKIRYKDVFKKYKYKCKICKSTEKLEVHHLDLKSQEDLKNLVLVCRTCHLKVYHNGCWKRKSTKLKCKRCQHEWIPRQKDVRQCPKCKSAYWDEKK